jgi:tight adherence protein B
MSPILYAFIFLAVVLAAEALFHFARGRRAARGTSKRLERLAQSLEGPRTRPEETSLREEITNSLTSQILKAIPGREEISIQLYRAGVPMTVQRFLLVSVAMSLAGLAVGFALAPGSFKALLFGAAGLLPWMQVRHQTAARMRVFEQQLPDALDLLVRSLRAGHSLNSGLQMVGEELSDPIGPEFRYVANEISLGKETKRALDNLLYRVPSADLPFFVTAISIQQETGSNLAEVLNNLSTVIRERFKVYGKVRAITAMGRMSANILAVWPLVMIGAIYLVNPTYIEPLWAEDAGRMLVFIATIMIFIGYVICRRMAEIKV